MSQGHDGEPMELWGVPIVAIGDDAREGIIRLRANELEGRSDGAITLSAADAHARARAEVARLPRLAAAAEPAEPAQGQDEPWTTILENDRPRADRIIRAVGVEKGLGYVEAMDAIRTWSANAAGFSGETPPLAKALHSGGLSLAELESTAIRLKIGSVLPGSTEAIMLAAGPQELEDEEIDDFGRVRFRDSDQDRRVAIVAGDDLALTREYLSYRDTERSEIVGSVPLGMERRVFDDLVRQWATVGSDLVATFAREHRIGAENAAAAKHAVDRRRREEEATASKARELREAAELETFLDEQKRLPNR